ncbi:MAG: hypothetical protein ABTS16_24285 [Candidatus Accumulibacter phosphatis]|uniref:Uncharacterized protein n=1 Tax=Candidatus Accumulibacter contiguus TaxID=2954381 RepID=A0ABX1TBV7_9PROT|nr:hypothetical protein [Candidatus Accumulibacter contiguus]NMQ07149.1 hypothetical protein [Candidatus Accumulibacter contiguus]
MKGYHLPSGLHHGLEFLIDPNWSPDQALAIVELLDDLRDRICSHYGHVLHQQLRNDRVIRLPVDSTDPPF